MNFMGKKEKKKIVLSIDSSDNRQLFVSLDIDGKKMIINKKTESWTSQVLLPLIEELLEKNKISIKQITEIRVNTGPGSYTGVRVGIAIANTLGWLLDIPVNGKKDGPVAAVY